MMAIACREKNAIAGLILAKKNNLATFKSSCHMDLGFIVCAISFHPLPFCTLLLLEDGNSLDGWKNLGFNGIRTVIFVT